MVFNFQGRVDLKDLNKDLEEYQKGHGLDDDQMNRKLEGLMNAFADLEIRPSSMGVFGPKSTVGSDTFTEMTEDERLKLPSRTLNLTSTSMGGKNHRSKIDTIKDIEVSVASGFNAADESGDEVASPRTTPKAGGGFMGRLRRSVTPSAAKTATEIRRSVTPAFSGQTGGRRSVTPAPSAGTDVKTRIKVPDGEVLDDDTSATITEKYGKSNKWAEISELHMAESLGDIKMMFTVEKLKTILDQNQVDYGKTSLKDPLAKMVWMGLVEGLIK